MAEYSQVFIDYCREVMPMDSFRVFMDFLGAEDVDVNSSLLRGYSMKEGPRDGKLVGGKRNKGEKDGHSKV